MAKTSIYLPDDLAEQVRAHGIPISEVVQRALRQAVHEAQIKEKVMTDVQDIQAVAQRLKLRREQDAAAARAAEAAAAAKARALGARWAREAASAEEIEYVATYSGRGTYETPISLVFVMSGQKGGHPSDPHWSDLQGAVREVWDQVEPLL